MNEERDSAKSLLEDYKRLEWKANPYERLFALADHWPDEIEKLLDIALSDGIESVTFLQDAVSYLAPAAFPRLVDKALDIFEENQDNELAQEIIKHISLQFPSVLHPYLTRIFEFSPNSGSHSENWPWRESGLQHFSYLRNVLTPRDQPGALQLKAWRCLLETRLEEVFRYALEMAGQVDLWANPLVFFQEVGYQYRQESFRKLYPEKVFHLMFEEGYLDVYPRPEWRKHHPTWGLNGTGERLRFGGLARGSCNVCGQTLHHLLTLSPVPAELGVTGLKELELATCLSCMGWEKETLWYRHSNDGSPEGIGYEGPLLQPQFVLDALVPGFVRLAETPDRWRWQDWGSSNSRQNLHRVGGFPSWIQSSQFPECPICKEKMGFLMQLDSDLPQVDGNELLWGSGGIGYIFWCDGCKISSYLWQCT